MPWTDQIVDAWHRTVNVFITATEDEALGAVEGFARACPSVDKDHLLAMGPLLGFLRSAKRKNVEHNERIVELERRIVALEARRGERGVAYEGVHEAGRAYPSGALVTRGGGLWLASSETTGTPGASAEWKLIVKRGTA